MLRFLTGLFAVVLVSGVMYFVVAGKLLPPKKPEVKPAPAPAAPAPTPAPARAKPAPAPAPATAPAKPAPAPAKPVGETVPSAKEAAAPPPQPKIINPAPAPAKPELDDKSGTKWDWSIPDDIWSGFSSEEEGNRK